MASPTIARPTPAEVNAIVAIPNRVIRNLRITDCYGRLAACVRVLTGEGANWCTFATWASRQAGATIRGEDLGDRLGDIARETWVVRHPVRSLWRRLLRYGVFEPESRLGRLIRAIHTPFDAFERASEAVADGNRKVFEEIGLQFASYLQASESPERFERFVRELKPGPAPDGQELLRSAFVGYQKARSEPSNVRRAQWMLLANLQIGLHEQTRLQPEIEAAMDSGPDTADELKRRLLAHLGLSWLARTVVAVLVFPARQYRRFVRELTRQILSETLMVLRTPAGLLLLGSNIDSPMPEIFAQPEVDGLDAMVRSVEMNVGRCTNCGAEDWTDLKQRMHYIFHLFSVFHENSAFFDAPFHEDQLEAMRTGRIPNGRL